MGAGIEVLIHAPRDHHDEVLREGVAPLAQDLPGVEALFFARYNKPDWHLRLAILGRAPGEPLDRMLASLRARGLAQGDQTQPYVPDLDAHGGAHGARLAEQVFHHDTRACLAFLALEAGGKLGRTRREISLLLTERFLDLLEFTREERIAFYRFSYSWAEDRGVWSADEHAILDRKYASLAEDLRALLREPDSPDLWGGQEALAVATGLLESLRPLAEELRRGMADGRIARDAITLTWSLTHLHANRLQIEAYGEAILRYLMHRLHEAA
jgi:thiopeptide-type bacteriocin biosynthesis protein